MNNWVTRRHLGPRLLQRRVAGKECGLIENQRLRASGYWQVLSHSKAVIRLQQA